MSLKFILNHRDVRFIQGVGSFTGTTVGTLVKSSEKLDRKTQCKN